MYPFCIHTGEGFGIGKQSQLFITEHIPAEPSEKLRWKVITIDADIQSLSHTLEMGDESLSS